MSAAAQRSASSAGGSVPHVTACTIVERDGRFLFVEEIIQGASVINQPAGHWEYGETLIEAAVRETLEETAWDVEPFALVGVYEHKPAGLEYGFVRFAYAARALRHHPERPLDAGIERAVWLDREALILQRPRHRGPMVERCVDDFLAGRRYPLDLTTHLL
jgi:8-oxo-dGTP pyrophosphatase MutT (NUDIX family)